MSFIKKRLKLILSLLLAVIIAYLGISLYIADSLSKPNLIDIHIGKDEVISGGEDIEFLAPDGLRISGWFFSANSDKTIIMVHGIGDTRTLFYYDGVKIAQFLHNNGYNILMFDLRSHGQSEGTRLTYGLTEGRDVIGAVNYLESRGFEKGNIAIIAESLGAISTLMQINNLDVGAIIVDSPAARVEPIITREMTKTEGVPEFMVPGVYLMAKLAFNIDVNAINPIDLISSDDKLLIFHGEKDSFIPVSDAQEILEKSSSESRLVIFPDTTHIETYKNYPEIYTEEVLDYLSSNLLN